MPVAKNFKTVNVEAQKLDPTSVLHLYKELLRLRSTSECFKGVSFKVVHVDTSILAYTRSEGHCTFLIIINFKHEIWRGPLNGITGSGVVEIDSEMMIKGTSVRFDAVTLNKAQALVIKIK